MSSDATQSVPSLHPLSSPPQVPTLSCHFVDVVAERVAAGVFREAAAACAPHAHVTFNSREAQFYETDLFVGKALILLRPAAREDDVHYAERLFDGRSRCLEFQVQGRFKRAPRGAVYIGGEVSSRMQLGLVRVQLTRSQLAPRYLVSRNPPRISRSSPPLPQSLVCLDSCAPVRQSPPHPSTICTQR